MSTQDYIIFIHDVSKTSLYNIFL